MKNLGVIVVNLVDIVSSRLKSLNVENCTGGSDQTLTLLAEVIAGKGETRCTERGEDILEHIIIEYFIPSKSP